MDIDPLADAHIGRLGEEDEMGGEVGVRDQVLDAVDDVLPVVPQGGGADVGAGAVVGLGQGEGDGQLAGGRAGQDGGGLIVARHGRQGVGHGVVDVDQGPDAALTLGQLGDQGKVLGDREAEPSVPLRDEQPEGAYPAQDREEPVVGNAPGLFDGRRHRLDLGPDGLDEGAGDLRVVVIVHGIRRFRHGAADAGRR